MITDRCDKMPTLQNLQNGTTEVVEALSPQVGAGQLLIRATRSLISAGTVRMLVDFGKAGLIDKARQQPEKVKQMLDKVRTDGLLNTAVVAQCRAIHVDPCEEMTHGRPCPLAGCKALP